MIDDNYSASAELTFDSAALKYSGCIKRWTVNERRNEYSYAKHSAFIEHIPERLRDQQMFFLTELCYCTY
jgi:hypothetical protein